MKSNNNITSFGHGGDIYRLSEELGMQERRIIDFSASINPLGVSKKIKAEIRKHLKYLNNYPDPEAKRLRIYLAKYHGVNPDMILCGNGSTELIYLITQALIPRTVLIAAPTFSEYEKAVLTCTLMSSNTEQSSNIRNLCLSEEKEFEIDPDSFISAMNGCDMAFLCNPNNPTGRLLGRNSAKRIADAAKDMGCMLIIDEAFIDFCPGDTLLNDVQNNPYLIVLRSMTKFYALSGLRIGYGVFPQYLSARLRGHKEPWTVNSLAQRAAVVGLKDKVYESQTFKFMKEEKRFFEDSLKKLGIRYFPSDANFYLLKISNGGEVYLTLRKKGILVRDCTNFRGLNSTFIRVAVKSHRENTILLKLLQRCHI